MTHFIIWQGLKNGKSNQGGGDQGPMPFFPTFIAIFKFCFLHLVLNMQLHALFKFVKLHSINPLGVCGFHHYISTGNWSPGLACLSYGSSFDFSYRGEERLRSNSHKQALLQK